MKWVGRASDRELATWLGAALLAGAALPLLLVRQPPYQDLAGHLAAVTVVQNPGDYPEYVFNGFLKTNGALTAFVWLLAKLVGVTQAGRLFVLLVLGANAFVLPRFVLRFAGRARMLVASLLMPPLVHGWYASMGMLDFHLGVACAMALLVALDRQREKPSPGRAAAVALLGVLTWFAHQSPLMIVELLVGLHVVTRPTWSARIEAARALVAPLLPATALAVWSGVAHLHGAEAHAELGGATEFPSVPELVYDLWAHWGYGYTELSVSSLVTMAVLAVLALRRAREPLPFFGPWGALALLLAYLVSPYYTLGLGYAGSRFIPFVWMAALLRVPDRLSRGLTVTLAASAALYLAGMAVDDVRLAREEDELASGAGAVPWGAKLDVFLFSPRITSKNTWSLSTSWGDYVVARHAHTWELWADSPSLALLRRGPPPPRLEPLRHRRFLDAMATRAGFCAGRRAAGLDPARCDDDWRAEWASYWREVDPYVDHLLMWDPPADSLEQVPAVWRPSLQRGRLWIFERDPSRQEPQLHVDAPPGPGGGG
ncbi:MAG TPA: hypothetical protein VIF15_15945 [Polyangiaceae bacterium]